MQSGVRPFDPPRYSVNYDLYSPSSTSVSSFPFFLLLHGFGGRRSHLSGHAASLSSQGCLVLNCDMSGLMSPSTIAAQERNILQAVSHVNWAMSLKHDDGTPMVDPKRIFLSGHSAGGAIALEATIALRKAGAMVRKAASMFTSFLFC